MLLMAQEHVRNFGIESIPQLIDQNEAQICQVLQQSQIQVGNGDQNKLSDEMKQIIIEEIKSSIEEKWKIIN